MGRGLVTIKVSWQVGGRVGMENLLEMATVGEEEEEKERNSRSGGPYDEMEMCVAIMDFCAAENLCLDLYRHAIINLAEDG